MFARILQFEVKPEKKMEFINTLNTQVVPILKKQIGFLEILPFTPVTEKTFVNISVWATKVDAERYQKETYPRVYEILKPFLTTPVNIGLFALETEVCRHFVESLAA